MLDDSKSCSFDSSCLSQEELALPVLPSPPSTSAILQTQDDISSESDDCSTTDGHHDMPVYDLQLVLRALKSSLQHQEKTEEEEEERIRSVNNCGSSSTSSNSNNSTSCDESLSCLDTPTYDDDQGLHTPTTSTSSGIKHIHSMNQSDTPRTLANHVHLPTVDLQSIQPNLLSATEQEKKDETASIAMHYFFQNQFMKAKRLFEQYAESDPLHSLGLSSMLFLKAVMTNDPSIRNDSLAALLHTYDLVTTQLEVTVKHQSALFGHPLFQYVQHCYYYLKCGNHHLASHSTSRKWRLPYRRSSAYTSSSSDSTHPSNGDQDDNGFVCNGILRAHIIKAECCLQMALLYLLQSTHSGYIKCGINIRRAYASYYFVWQEHQRMGQFHSAFIDKDTLSGLQFGIGAVHLILDSLPSSIRQVVSSFTWQPEKQLGLALLQLSKEGDRMRSPWASLLLLSYYTILTSACPQILMSEYTQPAIEVLLEAQQMYPHSAFFLHFAGRTSRIGRNLTLSTQSFLYAIEISKNDWAELDIFHTCSHEIGFNAMMQMDWEEGVKIFDLLYEQRYWSPGVFRFLHASCLMMMGMDTDAILLFAQVPALISASSSSGSLSLFSTKSNRNNQKELLDMEIYALQKVQFFESGGYQDCRLSLCALEYVCIMNGISFMTMPILEQYLALIDDTLQYIVEMEQLEYTIREKEMDPDTPLPNYVDQRAVLLWIKACIFNTMERYDDAIPHLNWIVDHKNEIEMDQWVIPYAFWEAGVTAWNMDDRTRGREFWEKASTYRNYAFENRMTWKIHLALAKADNQGVPSAHKVNNYRGRSDFKPVTLTYCF